MTRQTSPARQTRQRTAVKAALDGRDDFMSAQQLHDLLRHQGESVGLTTVYRSLQGLAEAGEVDLLVTDDGETVRIQERLHTPANWDPVGRRVEGGWRVKGHASDGRVLLHRGLPGFVHEQRCIAPEALDELAPMAGET